ncbi:protein-L-isoaspartate O-methyltransferase family protein [Couchioplanes caeruleus]|uniref:Protein-L-isoaspartate O-methyltransferase n=1 Tax=Couchioplanes caeruleus TaxID=56438 RepID=A0A3N1GST8_9ACTN|nr:methyltransferase domain-containing protein [Couchioplanes caeruleus]ROP33186.1 protein-L-isoaspartate O-methyltransferase [Couchioplanes caeruleus]
MTDLRRRFVERIRRDGAPLSPQLSAAFAAVPREAFVVDGFQRRDGTWARPGSAGFLEDVYRNDVLVTKLEAGIPVSSSSQPSLMAIMLAALDVQPGDRVLEIGAGTGYNAALLTVLGARVTTVDVQADVVERARSALARTGIAGVRLLAGDGYAGAPGERFDGVIVTVGVAGVSPSWLEQAQPGRLTNATAHAGPRAVGEESTARSGLPGAGEGSGPVGAGRESAGWSGQVGAGDEPVVRSGPIVVPVEHAGTHPVLAVHGLPGRAVGSVQDSVGGAAQGSVGGAAQGLVEGSAAASVTARVVCPSGFMTAAGPLTARHARSHPHPVPADSLAPFGHAAPSRWDRPLDSLAYRDLWYAAGVWSTRATHAAVPGRDGSTLILLDETGTGGAAILPDGSVLSSGAQAPRYAAEATEILDRWESANRPPMHAWRITLALTGDPAAPIWCPATWELDK